MPVKINKADLAQEIAVNFNLTTKQTEAALLLLETRAANMDMSLQEYMNTYHPQGFSERDYKLSDEYKGYVRFLADDAKAIIRTGKTADFFTFLHEQAHIYRRQLSGDLKEKAEKAFGVENGTWTRHQEELFALGYEEYARLRMAQTEDLREVYEKGCRCMRHIYNGLDRIIELNPDIIKVYDELFTESRFRFKQDEFEKVIDNIAVLKDETVKFKSSHIYLGMTPPIYQELGFERLPVMITAKHIKTAMMETGNNPHINYHGITPEIVKQIPDAIKKPVIIMQSQKAEHAKDIIAVLQFKDKKNRPVFIPFSPNKKGYLNHVEIDINLAKTIYGRTGFKNFLKKAVDENRILYINKKSRALTIPEIQFLRNHKSQLFYDNIARYQEIVKQKYPDFAQLYQQNIRQELENIREKYIDTNTWMKAPNGHDTNLNERQWLQVRTESFKKWFGDWEHDPEHASKVLDENGESLVVYHGTNNQFDIFDNNKIGETGKAHGNGFYFSNNKKGASYYGKQILGVFINAKKIISDQELTLTKKDIKEIIIKANSLTKDNDILWAFDDLSKFSKEQIVEKAVKTLSNSKSDIDIFNTLVDFMPTIQDTWKAFDNPANVFITNNNETYYIVGTPNQIKSATDNRGYFDIHQDNIYFQSQKPAYYSSNQYELDFLNDPLKKENATSPAPEETTLIPCTVLLEHGFVNGNIYINKNYACISLKSSSSGNSAEKESQDTFSNTNFQLLKSDEGYYFEKDNHTYYVADKIIEMGGQLVNTQAAIDMTVKKHKHNIKQITADGNKTITCKTFQQHLQKMCDNRSTEKQIVINAQILIHKMPLSERLKMSELTKELAWTTPEKTKENLVKIARNEITLLPQKSISPEKLDYTYGR